MELRESAESDSDHRDINPGLGAGFGGFVITHQPAVAHQPAEGSFADPAAGQDRETFGAIGTLDHRDRQFGTESLDPLGKSLAGVAAVHPEDAQPGEPAQPARQQQLRAIAFGDIGRGDRHAQHPAQSIHQQMTFAAFDLLGGVITHRAAVTGGFDALTVQDGGGGPAAVVVAAADQHAQGVMNHGPLVMGDPLAEEVINRFPVGKIGGQITPGTAAFDQIQDGVNETAAILGRTSAFGDFWQQGFEVSPLGVG